MGKRKRNIEAAEKMPDFPCIKCKEEYAINCICCSRQSLKKTWSGRDLKFYCSDCCFTDGKFDFHRSLQRYGIFTVMSNVETEMVTPLLNQIILQIFFN